MNVLVDTIQWTYYKKRDGTMPIKIRIMFRGESQYFPVTYNGKAVTLNQNQWTELCNKPKGQLRQLKDRIGSEEQRARDTIKKITLNGRVTFSFARFKTEFAASTLGSNSFLEIFDQNLKQLIAAGRIGTYNSYVNAKNSFKAFLKEELQKNDIDPIEITYALLTQFDQYLTKVRQVNRNTVAIYMRSLKVVYNIAITETPALIEFYPFARKRNERNKYQIKTAAGKKGRALTLPELKAFLATDVKTGSPLWEAKQLWLLSFFAQGANFRDLLLLKPSNLQGGCISYVRHKTRLTENHEVPIVVPISPKIREIFRNLDANLTDQSTYILNCVSPDMSATRQNAVIKQKIKTTNKRLKKICENNNLPVISTYFSRHSYASLLSENGVRIDQIKDLLGHSSSKTTQAYLSRLSPDATREINLRLENLASI